MGNRFLPLILCGVGLAFTCFAAVSDHPLIFPRPQELEILDGQLPLGNQSVIAVPVDATQSDLFLARFLVEELTDRWGVTVAVQHVTTLPMNKPVILMGSMANPLVKAYCASHGIEPVRDKASGYVLRVSGTVALVAGADEDGAFYGLQSLRQVIERRGNGFAISFVRVRDWPDKLFRGIRIYLPGHDHIPFFKRFVRDFMALYKFNKLQIEVNAGMRLDRHPELNAGWVEFARDVNYSRLNYPAGPPHELRQNASHQDTADGNFLEKSEVADLVQWARRYHIDVIPEIPSLTHSYYLLTKHPELSEVPGERWPDTYCPSDPSSRRLYLEVLDEYLEVMKPKIVHVGHDELFAPINLCTRCKGKDMRKLFAEDLIAVHDHLAKRGIATAMWGDMLLENVRGKGPQDHTTSAQFNYQTSGALTPELVDKLPKDILVYNWFWSGGSGKTARAKANEEQLERFGFKQIYGNFEPGIQEYPERSKRTTLLGGAPSAWEQTTEALFGKDLILAFLGCEDLLWSKRVPSGAELAATVQTLLPDIRLRLRGQAPPSETGDIVAPVDISSHFNMPSRESSFGLDLTGGSTGQVSAGKKVFELTDPATRGGKAAIIVGTEGTEKNLLPREVTAIPVGQDATSLIFLQASARPATNKLAYRVMWDMDDSADLLAWYEVVYEDGFVNTIPIRYGVNLLEWNWRPSQTPETYCYEGDPIILGRHGDAPVTFFAYEWVNPRLGKMIKEVRLKGSAGFRGAVPDFEDFYGPVIPSNAVILRALSVVRKRTNADSKRLR
jgi:glycosyl hydrolase family 20